jgi:protocatechuate 3,4-dioxygenase beta subunit
MSALLPKLDMTMVQTSPAAGTAVQPGQTVTYQVVISNDPSATDGAKAGVVSVNLGSGLTFNAGSATISDGNGYADTVTASGNGFNVALGGVLNGSTKPVTITFTGTVGSTTSGQTLQPSASIVYQGATTDEIVYATDNMAPVLDQYNVTTGALNTIGTISKNQDSLVFAADGNIYYTSQGDGNGKSGLTQYNVTTGVNTLVGNSGATGDLAINPAGTLIVYNGSQNGKDALFTYNVTTGVNAFLAYDPTGLTYNGLAFDAAGNLYAAANGQGGFYSGNGYVVQLNPSTGAVVKQSGYIGAVDGLAYDPYTGNLFVAGGSSPNLFEVNPSTLSVVHSWNVPSSGGLDGLSADGNGNLFIANYHSEITKVDLTQINPNAVAQSNAMVTNLVSTPQIDDTIPVIYTPKFSTAASTTTSLVASVNGRVFADATDSGTYSASDAGLAGQTVQLLNGSTVVGTATTAADGTYAISGVAPGSYTVKVIGAAGDAFSTASSESVTLASGDSATFNVGEYGPATLSGTVFVDANGNGTYGAGDSGFAGQTVQLLNGSTVVGTATTAADGTYSITNVTPGTYTVKVIGASGDVFTTASTESVTLTSAGSATFNAGEYAPASVSGRVFIDANGNGTYGAGDSGFGGQTVQLLNGSTVVGTATTAADGTYAISGVAPGSYTVKVIGAAGDTFTTASTGSVTLTSGGSATFNAGEYKPGSIAGTVFSDANDNGVADNGETGFGGVTVNLLSANGQTTGLSTVTGNDGTYSFSQLAPDSYEVQVVAPAGDHISPLGTSTTAMDNLANSAGVISPITLASGSVVTGENAGVASPDGTISSFVFFDGQNTGTYHAGDAGVQGITVKLLNTAGQVVGSTTTDANGAYTFNGVAAGNYRVQVVAPQGSQFSTVEHASGNPQLDSDVNAQGLSGSFSVVSNQTTTGENAGLLINGNFPNTTPTEIGSGANYSTSTSNQVIVGTGDDNVHTGTAGSNVVVLGGNGNIIELGATPAVTQDVGISLGSLQAQTQWATNGYIFAGGPGASYLDGGMGAAYLMGGTGPNNLAAGQGSNTLIAGGDGSMIETGGKSTSVIYQAGDGALTIDNGLRSVDHLTVYGYSSGTIVNTGGLEELMLSATDHIIFNGPDNFTAGQTTGNSEITFVSTIAGQTTATLSFDANGRPVFTTDALPSGSSSGSSSSSSSSSSPSSSSASSSGNDDNNQDSGNQNSGDQSSGNQDSGNSSGNDNNSAGQAPSVLTETSGAHSVTLASGTDTLHLWGYSNVVTGGDDNISIDGDVGSSHITLGNGNNTLVLGGENETVTLGHGHNTVSGSLGHLTLTTTGAADVNVGGYYNAITLGDGDSTVHSGVGLATVNVGASGSNGGSIVAGGQGNSITTGSGHWTVQAGIDDDSVAVGGSNDTVTLGGYHNSVSVSTGHASVSGSIGQDIFSATDFCATPGTASLDITGFNAAQGDVLDLSAVLAKAGYTGSNLGNFLSINQSGNDTLVSVIAGGTSHLAADLHGCNASALAVGRGLAV